MTTFRSLLNGYRKEGHGQQFRDLFYVIDQLDLVQIAFEPISQANISIDSLIQSIKRLLELKFLPAYKSLNHGDYEASDHEKQVDLFLAMDPSLQEVSFDCIMAISKLSMHLRNAIYNDSQVTLYEQNAKAQRIRDEIQARRQYQEHLTGYVDTLASRANDVGMEKFEERLERYAVAMRAIQLEMT